MSALFPSGGAGEPERGNEVRHVSGKVEASQGLLSLRFPAQGGLPREKVQTSARVSLPAAPRRALCNRGPGQAGRRERVQGTPQPQRPRCLPWGGSPAQRGGPGPANTWRLLSTVAQRGPDQEQRQKQQPEEASRVHAVRFEWPSGRGVP